MCGEEVVWVCRCDFSLKNFIRIWGSMVGGWGKEVWGNGELIWNRKGGVTVVKWRWICVLGSERWIYSGVLQATLKNEYTE